MTKKQEYNQFMDVKFQHHELIDINTIVDECNGTADSDGDDYGDYGSKRMSDGSRGSTSSSNVWRQEYWQK